MTANISPLIQDLKNRGFMQDCTDLEGLNECMGKQIVTAYAGFDCTGPSLHVGHLMSIMILRRLQKNGHKPIVLLGGGTTKVGDPSGKDETRKMLSDKDIQKNMDALRGVFGRFLTFGDGPTDAVMVNNDDWLSGLGYIEFLREYGRHFSVNRMMSFDSVKLRLEREQNLSFIEFNYMILQAYDFLELNRRFGCLLQLGGSDQWGNIVNGIELARRSDQSQLFGLTTPLITTANGAKMGKTVSGAVWLNPDMLSDFDYWQFWRNTDDRDVLRFMKLFTDMGLSDIAETEQLPINEQKKILAHEATKLARGENAALGAADAAQAAFSGGNLESLPKVTIVLDHDEIGILNLVVQAGLATSNGEVRRLIKGGGVKLAGKSVSDEKTMITRQDFAKGPLHLALGKKKHVLVEAS
ncbi:MAG: tyrosine--tRNA ligase [SAR116 cluster bacterium]|nr:tyrosine--tRNA ligase [Paracoccaceae bacterium]RCL79458.1 MAG: tyrosine--tRNA ligase [SAR116 cluster bacterium]RPH14424.1 MAG: tyrosine--tRNA ligase [Alphaproteobacteria bacterium TMED150]HBQ22744.1 tyrosine--tRNA ligase [Alphaproteobacteria bacterium]